jgi:hypothetical protein
VATKKLKNQESNKIILQELSENFEYSVSNFPAAIAA